MKKMKEDSDYLNESVSSMTDGVLHSNENVASVSAVMEELAASMEEISATVEMLNVDSGSILSNVEAVRLKTDEGDELTRDIKVRAKGIKDLTEENITFLQKTINEMGNGISNISTSISESAIGVTDAAENVGNLANRISDIKSETQSNMQISQELYNEVNKFKQI